MSGNYTLKSHPETVQCKKIICLKGEDSMSNSADGIKIAIALLVVIGLASVSILIYRQSIQMTKKGTAQLGNIAADLDDTDKQIYDGMTLTGSDVISAINKYWDDDTCEVVVCTKDGVNAAYNFGPTIAIPVDTDLTGMPTTDARGLPFSGKASEDRSSLGADATAASVIDECKTSAHAKICDASKVICGTAVDGAGATVNQYLATQTGYNGAVAVSNNGFISSGSNFLGSVQKDTNGTIRRITFVQK